MVAAYLLVNTFALRNIFTSVYLYWSYILPTFYYPLHWLECTKWRVKQLLVRKEVSFCRSHNKPFSLNRNVKPRHSVRYYIFQYDFETATLSKIIYFINIIEYHGFYGRLSSMIILNVSIFHVCFTEMHSVWSNETSNGITLQK